MKIAPIPSRLGFVAVGRSALDFVTDPPYSMWLTEQDEGRITYEGHDAVIALSHDPMSYELDVALWRPSVAAEVEHPFMIVDVIRVADPAKAQAYRQFSATNEDSVQRGVAKLVSELQKYGLAALTGQADFYDQMSAARSEAAKQFGADLTDQTARKRADLAWQQRDFQAVVKAYQSMEDRLSTLERKRLRYAIEHIGE